MSKLLKTRYVSTDPEAVELGWKLKRVSETHAMRQRTLMEEFRAKSEALTEASQAEQTAAFEAIARKIGLEAKDYGDGKDWALNIERIAEGEVALVHAKDETRVLAAYPPHQCKDCGSYNLKKEAGCEVCGDCGSSKCG